MAPAVRLRGITKRFGAVVANRAVDLEVGAGTIHGIVGENGAGKSTLVSVLYGIHQADAGAIEIGGRAARIRDSADAIGHGIGMVHQHFMRVPTFTVLENVMLGAEGGWRLAAGRRAVRAELVGLARDDGLAVDPDALAGELPVGLQQRVEILKALRRGARILILDEPTGVLTPAETDRFFDILRRLRAQGVTVLPITHKLHEFMAVADRVSVMRAGAMVAHRAIAETSREELAELMVGRRVLLDAAPVAAVPGAVPMAAEGLGWRDGRGVMRLAGVSLALRAGEILGLTGIAGNGQSELLDLLAGIATPAEGRIMVPGRSFDRAHPPSPAGMRARGVAHVPEDRHRRGLVPGFEAAEGAVLGYLDRPAAGTGRWLRPSVLRRHCVGLMRRFDRRPRAPRLRSGDFSGGNQQKLVMAREIAAAPRVLLIGQTTRGVDIGGIETTSAEILAMKRAGCAVLLVSVELDEILALADRIAVINAGRLVGTLDRAAADPRRIGLMMAGIDEAAAGQAGQAEPAGPAAASAAAARRRSAFRSTAGCRGRSCCSPRSPRRRRRARSGRRCRAGSRPRAAATSSSRRSCSTSSPPG